MDELARIRRGAGSFRAVEESNRPADEPVAGGATRLRIGDVPRSGCESVARLLAAAFRDNPLNRTAIQAGDERRYRCNLHGMRATLAAVHGAAQLLGVWDEADVLRGAIIAAPPFQYPFPPPPLGRQLRCLLGQGWRVQRRWSRVYDALSGLHPAEPHWYLSVVGVDPREQGRGLGSALLARWLHGVDAEALASYLETDREELLSFYRTAGFGVVRELRVLDVPVWCLWRPAVEPAAHADARRARAG